MIGVIDRSTMGTYLVNGACVYVSTIWNCCCALHAVDWSEVEQRICAALLFCGAVGCGYVCWTYL